MHIAAHAFAAVLLLAPLGPLQAQTARTPTAAGPVSPAGTDGACQRALAALRAAEDRALAADSATQAARRAEVMAQRRQAANTCLGAGAAREGDPQARGAAAARGSANAAPPAGAEASRPGRPTRPAVPPAARPATIPAPRAQDGLSPVPPRGSATITPPPAGHAPAVVAPMPETLTTCDSAGCWTSKGNFLQKSGPLLLGPGGACSQVGRVVNCP